MAGMIDLGLDKFGSKARFENILHVVCVQNGLNRADLLQAEEDMVTGYVKLAFRPPKHSPEVMQAALDIHNIASDVFRGEVVRAAVPEFARAAIVLSDAILNRNNRIIIIDPDDPQFKRL